MACTTAGPRSPGFLTMGVFQKCIEESSMQNTSANGWQTEWNHDHNSHAVPLSYASFVNGFKKMFHNEGGHLPYVIYI